MSTIPGVTASTEVVNRNPRGNSSAILCLIGAADNAGDGVATPMTFTTYNQAASALGTTTSNGRLVDMAYYAFLNGAQEVIAVVASATGSGNITEYNNAFDAIKTNNTIDAVVVESTDSTIATALETHVEFTATNNRFRRGYVGLPTGSVVSDYTTRASEIDNDRMFVVGPNFTDSDGNELPGGITAIAGAMVAESEQDPARPVTGAGVRGMNELALDVVDSEYDTLHNGGVFTMSDRDSNTIMRYLTSATTGTDVIKEGTISKVRDYVMKNLKSMLEAEFKRHKLTRSTLKQIESRVLQRMSLWQGKTIVSPDHGVTVTVTADDNDPTKANVEVTYSAVYPMNFISLTITLNL